MHLHAVWSRRDHTLSMSRLASLGRGILQILSLVESPGHVKIEHGIAVGCSIALRRSGVLRLVMRIVVGRLVEKLLGTLDMAINAGLFCAVG